MIPVRLEPRVTRQLSNLPLNDSFEKNQAIPFDSLSIPKLPPQERFHVSVDPFIIGSAYRYHHPKQLEKAFGDLASPYYNSLLSFKNKSPFDKQDDWSSSTSSYSSNDLFLRWLLSSRDSDGAFTSRTDSSDFDDRLPYSSPTATMATNTFGEVPSYISNDWAQISQEFTAPWRLLGVPKYSFDESMKIKRRQK